MKVLITGIEGFVGPYIADSLLQDGAEVIGTYLITQRQETHPLNPKITSEQLDVTDTKAVDALIKKIRPDAIVHLAGFSSVSQSWKHPELCWKINVEGTRNLLEAVVRANINPTILIISSAEVYGKPLRLPITEEHLLNPDSPYGKSRKEMERLALEYHSSKKLKTIILRSFNHTGPGQMPTFVCSEFAQQVARIKSGLAEPVMTVGDFNVQRDFSDVRDIAKAYVLALTECIPGEIYNVCSGKAYSIKEILEKIIRFSGIKITVTQDEAKTRPVNIQVLQGSHEKFSTETGWRPEIDLSQTLKDLLEYHLGLLK